MLRCTARPADEDLLPTPDSGPRLEISWDMWYMM
jgi:hypothetical protein